MIQKSVSSFTLYSPSLPLYEGLQHCNSMLVVSSCKDNLRHSSSALHIPVDSESAVVYPARQLPSLISVQYHLDNQLKVQLQLG